MRSNTATVVAFLLGLPSRDASARHLDRRKPARKTRWVGWSVALLAAGICLPGSASAGSQAVRIPVGEERVLHGTLVVPPGLPAPAVLVLHTRAGLEQADLSHAVNLAHAGLVSLPVPYLNPRWDGQLHHPGYLQDLARVVDYLQARPEVRGRPVGVVGFSLGAAKGVLLAARHPGIKAVVGCYGEYDLRTLPQRRGRGSAPPMPVDVAAQVGAPVLLLHGEWDDETPLRQAESMRDALLRAEKVVEFVAYQKVYHRFDRGPASRTRSERTREGFTYRLDEKAREDAWDRTVAWFRKYLTAVP